MKPRVIIADDEDFVRAFLKTIIEHLNYDLIDEVQSGDTAVEIILDKKPDILLLDINMPIKTGLEVLGEMGDEVNNTCIIMITAVTDNQSVRDSLAMGADHFIRKDNPPKKIVEIIKQTWENFISKQESEEIKEF